MADYHDLVKALTWLLVNKLQSKSEYTRGLLGDGQVQVHGTDIGTARRIIVEAVRGVEGVLPAGRWTPCTTRWVIRP